MKYIGESQTLSANEEQTIENDVYVFSLKNEDYVLSRFITWDIVITEYCFEIAGGFVHLPSGVYLFCGDGDGNYDWFCSDEIVGRNIGVFQMSCDFKSWRLAPIKISSSCETRVFMPKTSNILPVTDTKSEYFLYMSYSDPMRKHKNTDFLNVFVF